MDGWFLEAFLAMTNFYAKVKNSITIGAMSKSMKISRE